MSRRQPSSMSSASRRAPALAQRSDRNGKARGTRNGTATKATMANTGNKTNKTKPAKTQSKAKAAKPAAAATPARAKSRKTQAQVTDRDRGTEAAELWTLRLYVTGRGERSESALRNLRRLCESNLDEGSYKIEVIDLLKNPELAKADEILAIPTLVRKLPEPMKRIIGDLSNADRALLSLDFPKFTGAAAKRVRTHEANP